MICIVTEFTSCTCTLTFSSLLVAIVQVIIEVLTFPIIICITSKLGFIFLYSMITRETSSLCPLPRKSSLLQLRSLDQMPRLTQGHLTSEVIPEPSNLCRQASGAQSHHSLTQLRSLLSVTMAHRINKLGTILTAQVAAEVAAGKSCLPSWTVMCQGTAACGIHQHSLKT